MACASVVSMRNFLPPGFLSKAHSGCCKILMPISGFSPPPNLCMLKGPAGSCFFLGGAGFLLWLVLKGCATPKRGELFFNFGPPPCLPCPPVTTKESLSLHLAWLALQAFLNWNRLSSAGNTAANQRLFKERRPAHQPELSEEELLELDDEELLELGCAS